MADMDCTQMSQMVLDGGELASSAARHHLAECPSCHALASDGGGLARLLATASSAHPEQAAAPSFQDLEAQLASENRFLGRLAGIPNTSRWLLTCGALLLPVGVGLAKLRPDIGGYPSAQMVIELSAFGCVALASCWYWLRPLYRTQPPHWTFVVLLTVGLLLPWLVAILPQIPADSSALPAIAPHGAVARAAACFALGSALALPVVAVVGGLGRRGRETTGFTLLPALAGAQAGLLGLELHCPNTSIWHLLSGHAPIALALPILWQLAAIFYRSRNEPRRA